jgi:hypothetical protein
VTCRLRCAFPVSDFGSPLGANTCNDGPIAPRPAPSRCQASGAATGRTARVTRQQSSYTDHDGSHVTQWRNSSEPSSSLSIVQFAATASMTALGTVAARYHPRAHIMILERPWPPDRRRPMPVPMPVPMPMRESYGAARTQRIFTGRIGN